MDKIFDTNVLLSKWCHDRLWIEASDQAITRSARQLIDLYKTNLIVSPVEIELLAGTRNKEELRRMRIFLAEFIVADGGIITQNDLREAKRIAQRVPEKSRQLGYRRQLGDCLIRALCIRFGKDPISFDKYERDWWN